eukprot:478435_1
MSSRENSRRNQKKHKPKKGRSRSQPINRTSDNQFENDQHSRGSYNIEEQTIIEEDYDTYELLPHIDVFKLSSILSEQNNSILFDSLIKVYSAEHQSYIPVAGLLTKSNLYLTSPCNYQIWDELRNRTNMDQVINGNDTQIDRKMAIKLAKNLDIIDNDKITNSQIISYFVDKTKNMIKLSILLSKKPILSLSALFGLQTFYVHVKDINSITIQNINTIDTKYIDSFMAYILADVAWIDKEQKHNETHVLLHKYHSNEILTILNMRKSAYFMKHNMENADMVIISPNNTNIIPSSHYKCKIVSIEKFGGVEPIEMNDSSWKYCLRLSKCSKLTVHSDEYNLTIQFSNNNSRYEWISYLDYCINYLNSNPEIINIPPFMQKQSINKMMNDFSIYSSRHIMDEKQQFSTKFNFGEYINYWEPEYRNSVIPKYNTLKDELLKNKFSKLRKAVYYNLFEECMELMKLKGYKIKAKDIGVNNKKFNIARNTVITINHLISLKLYTDYSGIQTEFKKHCRKKNDKEKLEQFIKRNSEIAFWSRYVKESCTFYGCLLKKKDIVYTGLKVKLIFSSMKQHFYCPLSTTIEYNIAQNFCDDHGNILKLKAANNKTRYFDVSWLSAFPAEEEWLFMGSSLKICDIYIRSQKSNNYVSALYMFEQIIDGQFIDGGTKAADKLFSLIQHAMNRGDLLNAPPTYYRVLFTNFIKKMQKQSILRCLWINMQQLNQIEHLQLNKLLCTFDNESFFPKYNINRSDINDVKQYEWNICGDSYKQFIEMKPRQYIESNTYEYDINNEEKIKIHFECCSKYSDTKLKCALFLCLDELPMDIEEIRIAFDVLCDKKTKYRHLMPKQWLSYRKRYCGFKTFAFNYLGKNESISWIIGVKIIEIKNNDLRQMSLSQFNSNRSLLQNENNFDMKIIEDALQNDDKNAIMEFCKALYAQNQQKDQKIKQLQNEVNNLKQSIGKTPRFMGASPMSFKPTVSAPPIKINTSFSDVIEYKSNGHGQGIYLYDDLEESKSYNDQIPMLQQRQNPRKSPTKFVFDYFKSNYKKDKNKTKSHNKKKSKNKKRRATDGGSKHDYDDTKLKGNNWNKSNSMLRRQRSKSIDGVNLSLAHIQISNTSNVIYHSDFEC